MKKKALSLVLCIILCLGLCVPALGAYNDDVTVSASLDKAEIDYDAKNDQTVKVTVSLSKEVEIFSMSMRTEVPEGLTLAGIEGGFTELEEGNHYNLTTGKISWYAGKNLSAKDLVILSVTIPAGTAVGDYIIGVNTIKLATSGQNDDKNWMNGAETSVTLKIKEVVLEKEETPAAKFSAAGPDTGKLTGLVDGGSYELTGASPASFTASGTSQALTGVSEGKLILVKKGDGKTTTDSDKQTISVSKAETPSLAAVQPTAIDGKGSIPTDSTHEISTDGKTFNACIGATEVDPGTYYVRVKAKGAVLASDSQKITINAFDPSKEATPTATFTATGPSTGTLKNLVSGMKYSVDGGETWTAATGTSAKLTGLSACTISVMMPGDGSTTTDSDVQTITVTKAKTPSLTATQPDTVNGKGSIPTDATHEISTDGKTYEACTGETADLEPGTYYVRVKAKDTVLASDSQTITIEKFVPSYTVSFDPGEGSGTMDDVVVKEGDYTLPENGFTAPEGMKYKAWSIDDVEYQPNAVYFVAKDTVVVALWQEAPVVIETVATPKLPKSGEFSGSKTITITCATKGADIYYTTDGTTPSAASTLYTGSFSITATTTVKAIAIKSGMNDSEIASATYTLYSGGGGWEYDNTIRVSMRLIGAELAKQDVDLGKSSYLPAYVTWIATTSYTLDEGATVYDLFIKATTRAGIRSIGADNNYVETIFAPSTLGGYELSEFTNGKRSGWMYTINGSHPGFGLKDQMLRDGDTVIWHYVNDYSYEVADWTSEGQWQALGDGTYYNGWLKAPDYFGGKSGETKEEEEKEENARFENGVVILEAETESGTASAKLDKETAETGLKLSKNKDELTVKVENKSASRIILSVDSDAAKAIADAKNALRVETDKGSVTLDSADVAALAKNGQEVRIVVEDQSGGAEKVTVTVGNKVADITLQVELPAPKDGQVLVLVNADGTEKVIKKSVVENGKACGEIPNGAAVKVIANKKAFKDVKDSDWFASAVDFVSSHELFQGVGDGEFAPKSNMTRAMLVTVLYRLQDEPKTAGKASFNDVSADTWYTEAVAWAAEEGIVLGNGDGFAPNDNITREQIATILYRYMKYLGVDVSAKGDLNKFKDGKDVSSWAQDAMLWAEKVGLFQGDDQGNLNPGSNATRAEVATLMQRLVKMLVLK